MSKLFINTIYLMVLGTLTLPAMAIAEDDDMALREIIEADRLHLSLRH